MNKHILPLSITLLLLLLFSGCQDPITFIDKAEKTAPAGMGYFILRIDGAWASRTIMPKMPENTDLYYTLEFYKSGETTVYKTIGPVAYSSLSDPVLLDAGTYDLQVCAYKDAAAAQMTAKVKITGISITSGQTKTVDTVLEPITPGGGQGTFKWVIGYPLDVSFASMTITKTTGGTGTTYYFTGGSPSIGKDASLSLDTGYYIVTFNLTREGKKIERKEILHIYQNLESTYENTFTEENFFAQMTGIMVDPNSKKVYDYGESLALNIYAVYDDGSSSLILDEVTSNYNADAPGTQNLVIRHTNTGYTANFTVTVNKKTGSAVSTPSGTWDLNTKKITVTASLLSPQTGQDIEYAKSTSGSESADSLSWQTTNTFAITETNTTYYVYARSKENTNYNAGETKVSAGIATAAITIDMVLINAGTFTMGSPPGESDYDRNNETQHSVMLTKSFYMGKYQVTQEQYQAVMSTNLSNFTSAVSGEDETPEKLPVEVVTWYDAVEFCNKLSDLEELDKVYTISGRTPAFGYPITSATVTADFSKNGYRLPTEAEWEYACRAGTTTAYNTGNTIIDNTGWYYSNSGNKTHKVGLKPANAWGLHDMHGNVYEWCWDLYKADITMDTTDPTGANTGTYRVIRGGSYLDTTELRSAFRTWTNPASRINYIGFRVVRTLSDNTIPPPLVFDATFTSIADMKAWLDNKPPNDANTPYRIALNVDNLGGAYNIAGSAGNALYINNDKYVSLDLSGSNLASIGDNAFNGRYNLTDITIPNSVTSIGQQAFYGCSSLTSITIPNSVTSIGDRAFYYCYILISVTFNRANTALGTDAFIAADNTTSLRTAYTANGIGTYTRPNTTNTTWTKQP